LQGDYGLRGVWTEYAAPRFEDSLTNLGRISEFPFIGLDGS
jgi:hypothetical protein